MNRLMKWVVTAAVTLGLAVGVVAMSANADDKPAAAKTEGKGTITGKLADKDGNAVAGARVSLVQPPGKEAKREQKALRQQNAGEKPPKVAGEKTRPEPLATTTTDKDGKFTFKDVAAGDYTVRAQLRGQGMAVARVSVAAGKTADVAMILKQGPGGAARKTGAKPAPTPEEREQRKQERKAEKKAAKSQA
jgi:hypothetical protein